MKTIIMMSLLSSVLSVATAQTADEKAIADQVEKLRLAMVDADKISLESLAAPELSYGHSSGRVEDKASFVQALVSGASDFKSITLSDQTIRVIGNVAIVRHKLSGETNDNGNPGSVNIGVMLVWHKAKKQWQLVARQAFKLP